MEGFLAWYERCEQRSLTFATLTPIALVGYRNELQRTQGRATSTVNGHLSALPAWCAWLTEERYLEVNPARRIIVQTGSVWNSFSFLFINVVYSRRGMPCASSLRSSSWAYPG